MLKDLLANASFLITMLFIGSQVFKDSGISRTIHIKYRVLLGIIGGLTCIILMYYGFRLNSGTFLDFRNVPEAIVAIMGGSISVIIMAILAILFRLFYFGLSIYAIIPSIGIVIISTGYILISLLRISVNKKCVFMGILGLIIRSVVFSLLISDTKILLEALAFLWSGTVLLGVITYYLVQYLVVTYNLRSKLKSCVTKDFLTGVNNTRGFDEYFNNKIKASLKNDVRLSYLMLDIDFFKNINDTYGHGVGNVILKEFAEIVVSSCRVCDVVSRIGGEEFSVIVLDCSLIKTLELAERIRINVENHKFIVENNKSINITVSIGVAVYPDTIDSLDNLSQRADMGLYQAKRSGRNKVCVG